MEESSRSLRWKLRSGGTTPTTTTSTSGPVKRTTNYCEDSSSSEEEEISSDDVCNVSSGEEDFTQKPTKKLKVAIKSGTSRSQGGSKKSSFKKARRSSGNEDSQPKKAVKSVSSSSKKPKASLKSTGRSIASYFGGKSPPQKEEKEKEDRKSKFSAETLAFLSSGVPEVVSRAQKVITKRKEEETEMETLAFFPKISQVNNCIKSKNEEEEEDANHNDINPKNKQQFTHILKFIKEFKSPEEEIEKEEGLYKSTAAFAHLLARTDEIKTPDPICCPPFTLRASIKDGGPDLPWIDKYKVESVKNLVGDKTALNKLTKWLKQWKVDIKDDGGTGRKLIEKKRRRRDSDSDFVTSEEEDDKEVKAKSLLIAGPPGCGKTTAVYVIAKHLGFHVVEVNFSSRRSGKEVMQRVEETVSSHRLESSENCLLLFKDIELLAGEEDEGFHAAVAQLITNAVRPIVMTTCQGAYEALDSKIEKKEPLRITFSYPKSQRIVDKILIPIISEMDEEVGLEASISGLRSLLNSITRHAGCDIRQVINQTQFLFSHKLISYENIHKHSSPSGLNLAFLCPTKEIEQQDNINKSLNEDEEEESICLTVKGRKKKELKELDETAEALKFLCDLDEMERSLRGRNDPYRLDDFSDQSDSKNELKCSYFAPNYLSFVTESSDKSGKSASLMRKLSYETDSNVEKWDRSLKTREEIGEYCDVVGDGGWDNAACLRTIVKQNLMDSVGRLAKRNGRMTSYFNRLNRGFVDNISCTFGFQNELEIAKSFVQNGYC